VTFRFRAAADVPDDAWDEVVARSADGWLFHTSAWLRARALIVPQRGYGIYDGDRLVGVCPVAEYTYRVSPAGRLTGLESVGPAFRDDAGYTDALSAEVFSHLRKRVRDERLDLLFVQYPPLSRRRREGAAPTLAGHGFRPHYFHGSLRHWGRRPVMRLMDLDGERGQWLASASERLRSSVRAVEREGLTVEEASYTDGWRRFRGVQEERYRHTHASVWPEEFFQALLPLSDRMVFYFGTTPRGETAALWVVRYDRGAMYLASGSADGNEAPGLGAALQFHAMEGEQRRGCRWYQIGAYFPFMDPGDKMFGIGEFKRRLGGRDVPIDEGIWLNRPMRFHALRVLESRVTAAVRTVKGLRPRRS
jgi:hypothetical protein